MGIGVEVESRGQGVATNLIRRSILLAGCLGFRAIKAEATGSFGMKTFATVGMQPASSIRYADFEYEGRRIFEGIGASGADSEGNPDTPSQRRRSLLRGSSGISTGTTWACKQKQTNMDVKKGGELNVRELDFHSRYIYLCALLFKVL